MNHTALFFISICLLILLSFLIWGESGTAWEQQLSELAANQKKYALVSFFLLAADILLPIPNSFIMFMNGFVLGILPGAGLSLLSLMTSALAGYGLGQISAYGLQAAADTRTNAFWNKYGPLAILISRGIPIVAEGVSILGGYTRVSLPKFFLLNLLGNIPIALLFSLFGSLGYSTNTFMLALLASFGLTGAMWYWGRLWGDGELD